ncbi:MAG: molybdate ABC transporter substrate-binding protein [Acidobacteriota bacterium]
MSLLLSSLGAQNLRPSLTIAAASDLSRLEPYFQQAFPLADLTFSFGSSGALARQIENGAPFDLFLSASEEHMAPLVKKGRVIKEEMQIYAIGRIGLWAQSGAIRNLGDLDQPAVRVIAIANPRVAPYGQAAVAALRRVGLWDKIKDRVVYGESIRQAQQFAETGNADCAILAWSLIFDRGGYLIPDDLHPALRQVAAPIRQKGKNTKLAEAFIQFLQSDAGRAIFAQRGFNLLPAPPTLRRAAPRR